MSVKAPLFVAGELKGGGIRSKGLDEGVINFGGTRYFSRRSYYRRAPLSLLHFRHFVPLLARARGVYPYETASRYFFESGGICGIFARRVFSVYELARCRGKISSMLFPAFFCSGRNNGTCFSRRADIDGVCARTRRYYYLQSFPIHLTHVRIRRLCLWR